MFRTFRLASGLAVRKQLKVSNLFNGQQLAHYYSYDDARISQLLDEGQAHKKQWSLLSKGQKEQKIMTFIGKLGEKQTAARLASLLSACTGKQMAEAQAELRVALKIFNFQLGHLYSQQKKRQGNLYRFEPLDFVTSIFDHRHPILSAFAYLALSLRTNNALILRPSPQVLPPVKLIQQLWQESSCSKVVQCVVDSESDPKHADSAVLKLINDTHGFISFSGRMKDGLDFHYYMSNVNEVFRENEFLLTSSDSAYVMKDLNTHHLEKAARIIARACFSNNGQNFNSVKRVFLDTQIAEEFTNILLKQAANYTIHSRILEEAKGVSVNQGYLAPFLVQAEFQESRRKIQELAQKYKDEIKLLSGGQVVTVNSQARPLHFIKPAIFKVQSDFPAFNYQNVTYLLPICFLSTVDSTDSCINKINSSIYGITSSLFTSDPSLQKLEEIAGKLDVGTVNVNTWEVTDGITYSGRKRSGKGFSFSPLSMNNIVRTKAVSYHKQ